MGSLYMCSTRKLSYLEQAQLHFTTHNLYNQCRRVIGDLRDVVFVLLGEYEVLYCCNRCGRSSTELRSFKAGHDCIKNKLFEYAEEDDRELNFDLERTHSKRDVWFYPAFSYEVAHNTNYTNQGYYINYTNQGYQGYGGRKN